MSMAPAAPSSPARRKVAVLISGRGSNLGALIDACAAPDFPASLTLVLSNKAEALGLERARAAGIETAVLSHRDYDSREAFDAAIDGRLRAAGVEIVCLAGFMRLLSAGFVEGWLGRMLNIHPSLLPAFKGLDTHERVLAAGVRITGCTVHFVSPEMDAGPILVQGAVPVVSTDTPATLAERVLSMEHRIYPHALRLLASGQARLEGERVVLDTGPEEAWAAGQIVMSPAG